MSSPGTNPNVPQIPQPVADIGALAYCVQALKQGFDSLVGFRGEQTNRAVTFNDLINYGIVAAAQVGAPATSTVTGLAAEEVARIAGDATNASAISTEATTRASADTTLTTHLSTEVTRAEAAEALLTPLTIANVGQYNGTTTNDTATAGNVGEEFEVVVPFASAVAATTGTSLNVTSKLVAAGDWEISGSVVTAPAGTTLTTSVTAGIGSTTATLPTAPNGGYSAVYPNPLAGALTAIPTGTTRVSLASATTLFLVANVQFTTSTMKVYGILRGRRAR